MQNVSESQIRRDFSDLRVCKTFFFSPSQNMLDITDYVNYSWVDTVASFEL